jgi:diguanylate cyclase (GGDEF)-like protein
LENAFLEPIKATQEIWQNCIPEKLRAQSADAGQNNDLSKEQSLGAEHSTNQPNKTNASEPIMSPTWCAHLAGTLVGQLPWLILAHSVAASSIDAMAERELLPSSIGQSERNVTTCKAALTGFVFSGGLQTSEMEDPKQTHFFENRLKQGISGALSFATMARANINISELTASRLSASSLLAKPLVTGVLSGGAGAIVGCELNSIFDYGRISSSKELLNAVSSQALIGSAFSSMGKLNPKQLSSFDCEKISFSQPKPMTRNSLGTGGVVLCSDNTVMHIANGEYRLNDGDQILSDATRNVLGAKYHSPQDVSRLAKQLTDMQAEIKKLSEENKHLQELATIDSLTKIKNVMGGQDILQKEFERSANRSRTPLSVLFLDLNGFKKVNDQIGHDAGDSALIRGAEIIGQRIRQTDDVYRKGGDEFVVVLPDTDNLGARQLARGIKENLRFEVQNADSTISLPVSTSIGVATFDPINRNFSSIDDLLHEADQQMYLDKHPMQAKVKAW